MTAFINSFLNYIVLFLIMAVLAGTGVFIGMFLRKRKNAKEAVAVDTDTTES